MVTIPEQAPAAYHILAKPTGAACNLNCTYCFFLSKEMLYPGSHFRMSDEVLETYIRQLLESHRVPQVSVSWQGGEPTLMGLEFYRRSIEFVEKYRRPDQTISYTIQTNGTQLDDEWCAFLKKHDFLVGLSVDGPREIHDTYRVDRGGRGSFDRVMRGWERLRAHQVEVNILCTVHAANVRRPLEVYRFFRDELGAQFLQFIPIVERATAETLPLADQGWGEGDTGQRTLYTQEGQMITHRSVKPKQYGNFLIEIFDEWVRHDVGRVYVQLFDASLANWAGTPAGICVYTETCGQALALEHTGDLYACDHFVEPGYLLGNIQDTHMIELAASERQIKFGRDKRDALPRFCRECEVRFACHGGCPRNRFLKTPQGEPGLNYLCAGYKLLYKHINEAMGIMANLLRQNRAPAEIMRWFAIQDARRAQESAGTRSGTSRSGRQVRGPRRRN
jgi:uncharacterized protein